MSEVCIISSVLRNKDLKWQTSVTAWLQLRPLFSKQRIVHPQGVRAGQPQRRGLNPSCLPLFMHFSLHPEPALCKLGLAKKGGVLSSPEVLALVLTFFLCSLFIDFPLSLSFFLATTILDSFLYSNYLTFPPQEIKGPILGKWGVKVSLATSC